eukprot:g1860.t1
MSVAPDKLEEKLRDFQRKLDQTRQAMLRDGNLELRSLREELEEAVSFTQKLIAKQRAKTGEPPLSHVVLHPEEGGEVAGEAEAEGEVEPEPEPEVAVAVVEDKEEEEENEEEEEEKYHLWEKEQLAAAAAIAAATVKARQRVEKDRERSAMSRAGAKRRHTVGSLVEALFNDGNYYPGIIVEIDSGKGDLLIEYIGFGARERHGIEKVRPLRQPERTRVVRDDKLIVGALVEGLYAPESKWYPAQLCEKSEHGWRVQFDGFDNLEELPSDYIRTASASGSAASAAAIVAAAEENASKKRKAVPVDPRKEIELIAIPEKLKVLDTDTADIIERKKKRLKSIHNKNRIRRRQMECNSRQVSWQSFQSSVAKLKKKKKKKILRSS